MAWYTPPAFIDAQVPTADDLNEISALLTWLHDNKFDVSNYGIAPLLARGSDTNTSGSWADVTGASITLGGAGKYVIKATARIATAGTPGVWRSVSVRLVVDGTAQTGVIPFYVPDGQDITLPGIWTYTAAGSGLVAKLQGAHSGETNTVKGTSTAIWAQQCFAP